MLKDVAPKARPRTTQRARGLRREMTLPEVLLWRLLRQRPGGLKFRRQHPSGRFILDFFCSDARLAIEVDGEIHGLKVERDAGRDAWLAQAGIETLRIKAATILKDIDAASDSIIIACLARLPLHHPATPDGPPPRDKLGED